MSRLVLMSLLLVACAPKSGSWQSLGEVERTSPSLHGVADQRLRDLMLKIDSLVMSEKEMTEIQRDLYRKKYTQKIRESAQMISNNAAAVRASLPFLPLNTTQQAAFLILADRMEVQARNIENLAAANHSDQIPDVLNPLAVTCRACHQLFRVQ